MNVDDIIAWLRKCPDVGLSIAVYSFLTQIVEWDELRTQKCGILALESYERAIEVMNGRSWSQT